MFRFRPISILPLIFLFPAGASLTPSACSADSMNAQTLLTIEPTAEYPRNSEGDIVRLPGGLLALVYTRFTGGQGDASTAHLSLRTSDDDGQTWSPDRKLVADEGMQNVMSVSLLPLGDREVLLFYLVKNNLCDCSIWMRRTTDAFQTLTSPQRVSSLPGYHVVNNARAVLLSTGRIIVPGALHVCKDNEPGQWQRSALCMVWYSDDNGKSWKSGEAAPGSGTPDLVTQEPGVVELADGRLLMWIRSSGGAQYQSYSSNGGESWSKLEKGPLVSPLSPASIVRIPGVDALLAVWNDHSGTHPFTEGKRTPLCTALSMDEGKTWGRSRVLENQADGFYCYTSITPEKDSAILSYNAGDSRAGSLSRLKVVRLRFDGLLEREGESR